MLLLKMNNLEYFWTQYFTESFFDVKISQKSY